MRVKTLLLAVTLMVVGVLASPVLAACSDQTIDEARQYFTDKNLPFITLDPAQSKSFVAQVDAAHPGAFGANGDAGFDADEVYIVALAGGVPGGVIVGWFDKDGCILNSTVGPAAEVEGYVAKATGAPATPLKPKDPPV